ncbi:MAG: glycosyltransferase family 2 protein [Bacteroidetes bacterium]|nr:glycosyltransferase family 2 protein [Bacteroidota bacterium]MCL6101856.1 glycosyltransferase family 2 protein [Bacteroidota bacterium]
MRGSEVERKKMNSIKKISIVILNWNGSSFLKRFLPSVVACSKGNVEIVVADNGSTDDSKTIIETLFPTVTYLQLKQNFGFAEGYNHALQSLESDYFLLLNSDVEVTPGWLGPMLQLMESDSSIGICQPKILSLDRPDEFEYAGAAGGFIDRFGYPYCRGRILQEVEKDLGQYDQTMQVSWASGACMMVRSNTWKACGGFDADFWAHMEEIDLCWHAQHLGYSVYVCPASVVFHVGGGTLSYDNPMKLHLNFRNNLYLLFKNLPGNQLATKLPVRMILDGFAAFVFLLKGEFGSFGRVFSAHLKFYGNLPRLWKKRRNIFRTRKSKIVKLTTGKNILWNYYILKRRKFSDVLID